MPSEREEARATQQPNPREEELVREPEMARDARGQEGPAGDPRMAEVPSGAEREDRVQQPPIHAEGMMQSELTGYRDRFADLQARFIDDPKGATDQAASLLKEAVDRLMESMGEHTDTERMRLGMQRYRQALETITDQTS